MLNGQGPGPVPAQPVILQASCVHPEHTCGSVYQQAFRHGQPALITHRHPHVVKLKLHCNRPWVLTVLAQRQLLALFEHYAHLLAPGSRAMVTHALGEWHVPEPVAGPFTADLLACVQFSKVPL